MGGASSYVAWMDSQGVGHVVRGKFHKKWALCFSCAALPLLTCSLPLIQVGYYHIQTAMSAEGVFPTGEVLSDVRVSVTGGLLTFSFTRQNKAVATRAPAAMLPGTDAAPNLENPSIGGCNATAAAPCFPIAQIDSATSAPFIAALFPHWSPADPAVDSPLPSDKHFLHSGLKWSRTPTWTVVVRCLPPFGGGLGATSSLGAPFRTQLHPRLSLLQLRRVSAQEWATGRVLNVRQAEAASFGLGGEVSTDVLSSSSSSEQGHTHGADSAAVGSPDKDDHMGVGSTNRIEGVQPTVAAAAMAYAMPGMPMDSPGAARDMGGAGGTMGAPAMGGAMGSFFVARSGFPSGVLFEEALVDTEGASQAACAVSSPELQTCMHTAFRSCEEQSPASLTAHSAWPISVALALSGRLAGLLILAFIFAAITTWLANIGKVVEAAAEGRGWGWTLAGGLR